MRSSFLILLGLFEVAPPGELLNAYHLIMQY